MRDDDYTDGIYAIMQGAAKVEGQGDWCGYSYEFHTDKFEFYPYMWDYLHEWDDECHCEGECPDDRPQFRHFATGLEIRWYKYLGRSMKSNKSMTALEFYRDVVVDCLEELKRIYEGDDGTDDYEYVFGKKPENWRLPLGALRLTLTGDPEKVDVVRAQHEVEELVRVLNGVTK